MEHERQVRDLRVLLEVSRALAGEPSLDNLLQIIVRKAAEVLEAERCSLFLFDEARNELWSRIAGQLRSLREIRLPVGVGIAGEVASTRKAANVADAYSDPRFNPEFDRLTGFHTHSILCAPMISSGGKLIGVIEVLNKRGDKPFDHLDEELLEALSSHAAVALDRAQLTEAYLEKKRMEEALQVAREIQMSLLPRRFPPFPQIPRLDLHAAIEPAKEVGGDFYDFFLIDEHRLFFAIGDVSGKGVPAALFMAMAKTVLNGAARKGIGPDQVLTEVNRELCLNNDSGTLVTILCGILNIETGEVLYANAGHNPPLVVRPGRQVEYASEGGGVVAGVVERAIYGSQHLKLGPGDSLFLYTDGITEARDDQRRFFSEARLKRDVQSVETCSSREIVEGIMDTIKAFSRGAPQSDDMTIMNLRLREA